MGCNWYNLEPACLKETYVGLINSVIFNDKWFKVAVCFIAFNPIFWNVVARLEYRTHVLTKLAGGARSGCYLLALTIFSLGIARDLSFEWAMRAQPTSPVLDSELIRNLGRLCIGAGQVLVLTSMYQLGITGTYLGDYFGILMDNIVTAFPFNVSNNPMYHGSTLSFLGYSLLQGKPAGLVITLFVHTMYSIALKFEEPFTAAIYAQRDAQRAKKD
ncbi:bifunctional phosphatidyl-N-methylethanolamine N-methyltransferase/phosphatidyl-N-dimethylethanolamine N-methyltransferase TDEL_0F00350 [Torulaspora delbrueckii]|uniref:Phosphatidyl-N-methylethanolamine N-methyltransferase n=1 Tax=Torulaspora delbrueckii TaxID=4950 RepID=G8ZW52_TORDE|nr:hypothetical protein TDEL_0F00350 [Torulaspora delbrueckii]CCE92846.1 hypothetical protein TDEL_0F00350 [Torulaspora delbrueckii]